MRATMRSTKSRNGHPAVRRPFALCVACTLGCFVLPGQVEAQADASTITHYALPQQDVPPLRLVTGQTVTAIVASDRTPVLVLRRVDDPDFTPIRGEPVDNSPHIRRLEFTAPANGTYRFDLHPIGAPPQGAEPPRYALTLTLGPEPLPQAMPEDGYHFADTLAPEDAQLSEDERGNTHEVLLEAGRPVVIDLNADAFDTFLTVAAPISPSDINTSDAPDEPDEPITWANDDWQADTHHSRIAFTPPVTGIYRLGVSSYDHEHGSYELTVTYPEPAHLLDHQGQLARAGENRRPLDVQRVRLDIGDHVIVDLRSDAFDTFLTVQPPHGAPEQVNDDWELSTSHSRIELTADRAGIYELRVSSFSPTGHGPYHLTVMRQADDE